jgi:hypothetical protein
MSLREQFIDMELDMRSYGEVMDAVMARSGVTGKPGE